MQDAYPLRFEPIFRQMIWGGDRLMPWLKGKPSKEPIGEAWILSDVDGAESVVTNGVWKGKTLRQVLTADPKPWFGKRIPEDSRFPLLLKFIDARRELSVQVHPNDDQALHHKPPGLGKTEAWVILEANEQTSKIYAGLVPGCNAEKMLQAVQDKTVAQTLHSFTPKAGDCVYLPAGTVHAIGADILLFEVQQSSDITYRLYDWDRVDPKSGKPRELHVDQAIACTDFFKGPCRPCSPIPVQQGEQLAMCEYFCLYRLNIKKPLPIPSHWIVICTKGEGAIHALNVQYPVKPGDVYLLPQGEYTIHPKPNMEVLVVEYC